MPATRPRRIVRRAVMALALTVVLLPSYVCSWGAMWWLYGRGTISAELRHRLGMTVFRPVELWKDTRLPGFVFLETLYTWSYLNGDSDEPVSWNEVDSIARMSE